MSTRPRSKEMCWRLIAKLEKEFNDVSDAYHGLSNECAVMLSNKDREMMDKCKRCARGRR